ncbi:MAG: YncE family protein [Methyloceanibacter sp.]|jgi:DNA-binding beta-propeller fold protein YncE
MSSRLYFTACLACVIAFAPQAFAQSAPLYTVTKTVALGAPDRWDFVVFDPASHKVFVAHGDRVTVVDGRTGAILGNVEGLQGGAHGIAIVPGTGRGYTDDGRAGTAASFDLDKLNLINTIKADADADAIVFDPTSGHVFVVDGDPGKLTVIDPKSDSAVATIDAGGKLETAVADDNGKLYVNGEEKREIIRVDTATNQVDGHWPIPNCTSPHGLALDPEAHRLFSSCTNNVLVIVDADTGTTIATLPIGARSDAAAFDPKRKLIFSSNGDGSLSVIAEKDANTFVTVASVATLRSARTMAVDPVSGRLYVVAADTTVNPSADPSDLRHRYVVTPGSAKLLFLDPAP